MPFRAINTLALNNGIYSNSELIMRGQFVFNPGFGLLTVLLLLALQTAGARAQTERDLQAPNFLFTPESGKPFYLYERLQAHNKPTLLYFWATWCPYCRKATPKVVALHQDYSRALDVMAINVGINDTAEKMTEYMYSYQMEFPVMFDENSEISQQFQVYGTPVFVILSAEGEIIYRSHRYPQGLEEVLSAPATQN